MVHTLTVEQLVHRYTYAGWPAAIAIQRYARRRRAVTRWHGQRRAATRIQAAMRGLLTRRAIARVKGVRRARLEIVRREVATYASSLSAHGSSAVVAALDAALDRRNSQPSPRRARRPASSPRRSRPIEGGAGARQHANPRDKARSMAQGARLAAREAAQAAGERAALAAEAEGIGVACSTKVMERPQQQPSLRPTTHFVATRLRSVATQTDDGASPQGEEGVAADEEGAAGQAAVACAGACSGSSVVRSHTAVRMEGDDLLLIADDEDEDHEADDATGEGGEMDAATWEEEVAAAQEGHGWVQRALLHMQRSAASIRGTGEAEDNEDKDVESEEDDDDADDDDDDDEGDDPRRRSVTNLDTGEMLTIGDVSRMYIEQEVSPRRGWIGFQHLFRDWAAEGSTAEGDDAAVRRLHQHAVELEVEAARRGVEVQQLREEMTQLRLQLKQATEREQRRGDGGGSGGSSKGGAVASLRDDLGELLAQKLTLQEQNAALKARLDLVMRPSAMAPLHHAPAHTPESGEPNCKVQ
tara:strand:- start:75 stop:1658 length:1584 start_codon:yes stop_codon:yes gene_type:complete